jgi:hypothetical protein
LKGKKSRLSNKLVDEKQVDVRMSRRRVKEKLIQV